MAYGPYGKASGGYSTVPRGGSPTHTEAWALTEAARRMAVSIAAFEEDSSKDNKNKMRDAVRLNWRLWTIFQAELTVGNSNCPENLRIDMLTLCKYIDNHTVELLADTVPEKILPLVDINRNIASGLLEGLQTVADAQESSDEKSKAPESPPTSVNEIS